MKKIVILGGSGVGMAACAIVDQDPEARVFGFLNDIEPVGSHIGEFKKIPVIGKTEDVTNFLHDPDAYFFLAYVGMQNEEKTFLKLLELPVPNDRWYSCIDKTAVYPKGYCRLGQGILMAPLSQIGPDVTLCDNCMLFANAYVGHNSFLERFAHVATNAVVGANVHVGKGVHIGSNATIKEKVTIGDFALIGSGAVVIHDVPSNTIVVGNPARVLRVKEQ